MLTRRTTLALITASLAAPALARDNPMPDALRKALERNPAVPVLGNPKGDITLTQFFDYNCPQCRRMASLMPGLIAAEPGLRIVMREWPVFGEGSWFAARAALASLRQGKYWQMHAGLMALRERAEEASVLRVAAAQGLDLPRLRADMTEGAAAEAAEAQIAETGALADHMSLVGTPTFVAGDRASFGRMTLAELREMIAEARREMAQG